MAFIPAETPKMAKGTRCWHSGHKAELKEKEMSGAFIPLLQQRLEKYVFREQI